MSAYSRFLIGFAALLIGWLTNDALAQQNASVGGGVAGWSARQNDREQGQPVVYRTKFNGPASERRLEVYLTRANLKIVPHNSDELVVEGNGLEPTPERAKGLQPLSGWGTDNTGIGLNAVVEGATIKLLKVSKKEADYVIKVPKNVSLKLEETAFGASSRYEISDIDGEIEVKLKSGRLTIKNATGPVVANNTNGEIEVQFTRFGGPQPSAITTVNGEVDVTLPADAKVNLKTKSLHGDIYTDFDVKINNGDKGDGKKDDCNCPRIGGSGGNTDGTINGGGVELRTETINGNVYIRKLK
jgi:Putative adhesin